MRGNAISEPLTTLTDTSQQLCNQHAHLKKSGSCEMTVTFFLRSRKPMRSVCMPSTVMSPPHGSTSRVRAAITDDLPAPVRPTTPIFCPGVEQ